MSEQLGREMRGAGGSRTRGRAVRRWVWAGWVGAALIAAAAAGPRAAEAAPHRLLAGDRAGGNDRIRQYDGATGASVGDYDPTNVGGLNAPQALILGADDLVYAVSQDTQSVKRYDPDSGAFVDNFVTVSANGGTDPAGADFDSAGRLYVSNFSTRNVLRYTPAGVFDVEFVSSASGTGRLSDLLIGADDSVYVMDYDGGTARRYSAAGALLDASFLTGVSGGSGTGMDFGPDGLLYGANSSGVKRRDPAGGPESAFALSGSTLPGEITGLAFGQDGNLYVADSGGAGRVLRYQGPQEASPGAFIDVFVPAGSGGLTRPLAIAFIPEPASLALVTLALAALATRRRRR